MGKLQCESPVPSDISIAQAAKPVHISEVAQAAGLSPDEYDLYGTTKAKVGIYVLLVCHLVIGTLIFCSPILAFEPWEQRDVVTLKSSAGQAQCHPEACLCSRWKLW